eukprot:g37268.t1
MAEEWQMEFNLVHEVLHFEKANQGRTYTLNGRLSNNDETQHKEEIEGLVSWCKDNNLSLNDGKTKEMIIDFRKKGGGHAPIYISGAEVDRVEIIKFLGKAFMASHGNCSAQNHNKLQRVVNIAQTITQANLPSTGSNYTCHCCGRAANIIKDPSRLGYNLFHQAEDTKLKHIDYSGISRGLLDQGEQDEPAKKKKKKKNKKKKHRQHKKDKRKDRAIRTSSESDPELLRDKDTVTPVE